MRLIRLFFHAYQERKIKSFLLYFCIANSTTAVQVHIPYIIQNKLCKFLYEHHSKLHKINYQHAIALKKQTLVYNSPKYLRNNKQVTSLCGRRYAAHRISHQTNKQTMRLGKWQCFTRRGLLAPPIAADSSFDDASVFCASPP